MLDPRVLVNIDWLWVVPVLPLAVSVVNLFLGRRLGKLAGWIASAAIGVSFLLSLQAVRELLGAPAEERLVIERLFDWISVGGFTVGATLRLDVLSATMILVVTGVGFLIHVYAIGVLTPSRPPSPRARPA